MNIVIINYKSGNLASLTNSLDSASKNMKKKITINLSNKPDEIIKADKVILPGVGDFSNCKKQLLNISGMEEAIEYYIKKKANPFLGICIGMQLMAKISYERKKNKGLGIIDSEVIILDNTYKDIRIPHMGWNNIEVDSKNNVELFPSLDNNDFYFVHSYHMKCKNNSEILATTNYGEKIVAAVLKDNVIGVQFHPEKSQLKGKKFLEEFLSWCP